MPEDISMNEFTAADSVPVLCGLLRVHRMGLVAAGDLDSLGGAYPFLPTKERQWIAERLGRLGESGRAILLEDAKGRIQQIFFGQVTPYDGNSRQWAYRRFDGDAGERRPDPGLILVEGADRIEDARPARFRSFSTWAEGGRPLLPAPVIPLSTSSGHVELGQDGVLECRRRSVAGESHMCAALFTVHDGQGKQHWVSTPWSPEEVRQRYGSLIRFNELPAEARHELDARLENAGLYDRIIMAFDDDARGKRPREFFFGRLIDAKGTLVIDEVLDMREGRSDPACVEPCEPVMQDYLLEKAQAQDFFDRNVAGDAPLRRLPRGMERAKAMVESGYCPDGLTAAVPYQSLAPSGRGR